MQPLSRVAVNTVQVRADSINGVAEGGWLTGLSVRCIACDVWREGGVEAVDAGRVGVADLS